MKKIFVKDILDVCNAELFCGDINLECNSFSNDTRKIVEKDIYIGIKGENFDGNNFFTEAFDKGAIGCILEKESFNTLNVDKNKFKDKTIIYISHKNKKNYFKRVINV